VLGVLLSIILDAEPGGAIVLTGLAILAITLITKRIIR